MLQRRTPLTNKKEIARSGPLKRKAAEPGAKTKSQAKRKKSLRAAAAPLQTKRPLGRNKPLQSNPAPQAKRSRAAAASSKLPAAPPRSRKGPERDAGFLAYVREQACLFCGTRERVEAHHFGKRGKGTKCSDYETVPLCHDHHVEGWHRHGTLPGKTRSEWLEVFRALALGLLSERSQRAM